MANNNAAPQALNNAPIYNDEVIDINVEIDSTVTLNLRRHDKIKCLKQVGLKQGISTTLQQVFYGDRWLEDDFTLAHYGLSPNDTVTVQLNTNSDSVRRLYVKFPSENQTVEVFASVNDTVHQVKSIVVAKAGLDDFSDEEEFDLMFNWKLLSDHYKLSGYKIPNDTLLFAVTRPVDTQAIRVKVYGKGVFNVEVKVLQTIAEMKLVLATLTETTPREGVRLFHEGRELKDAKTFVEYDIEEGDTVELMTIFPIPILMPTGEYVSVDVYPTEDAFTVLLKLNKQVRLPKTETPLIFNGEVLDSDVPLSHYNVVPGSTLRLVVN